MSEKPPTEIADYDPSWTDLFSKERSNIFEVTDGLMVSLEHIGSTSVPGLGAKPIIDIMGGVRSLTDAEKCIAPLQAIGYEYVPDYEDQLPERRYFRKGAPIRKFHLHVVEMTTEFWKRHLLFRDYLRKYPEEARRYEELKRELASPLGTDRLSYTEAKTEFVTSIESKARGEAK